jgi:hypothetical protein
LTKQCIHGSASVDDHGGFAPPSETYFDHRRAALRQEPRFRRSVDILFPRADVISQRQLPSPMRHAMRMLPRKKARLKQPGFLI